MVAGLRTSVEAPYYTASLAPWYIAALGHTDSSSCGPSGTAAWECCYTVGWQKHCTLAGKHFGILVFPPFWGCSDKFALEHLDNALVALTCSLL